MSRKVKNQILSAVSIEAVASDGKGVARWHNQVVFIEGVAPGDIVDVRVIRKKRNYLEAVVEQVVQHSQHRVDPFCNHFGTCGGCKWQHIAYHHQLALKRQLVIDSLQRIGALDFPEVAETLASPQTQYHRNKLEFTFSNRRWLNQEEINSGNLFNRNGLGFHKPRQFDKIVDIDHCYLQPDPSNQIRNSVRAYAFEHQLGFYDIRGKKGFLRNLIVRTASNGELMVILQVGHDDPALNGLMNHLQVQYPEITSLYYVINDKGNETFFDLPVQLYAGKGHITDSMGALQFRIGPKSFYQTNGPQAHEVYKLVRDLASLRGKEVVYDLYTGAGTIALFLASSANVVVGIELVPEAIEDARTNAQLNQVNNAHFYAGDTKDIVGDHILSKHGSPQVVVTDPPRSGMHRDVVERLIDIRPERIVYVSCNPATQARDIALMADHYHIRSVHPVDMFPHTPHVECVVLLESIGK